MINKIDNGSGVLNFEDFQMVRQQYFEIFWIGDIFSGKLFPFVKLINKSPTKLISQVMGEKNRESDMEIHFKDTFRAFSKDNDGNLLVIVCTAKE